MPSILSCSVTFSTCSFSGAQKIQIYKIRDWSRPGSDSWQVLQKLNIRHKCRTEVFTGSIQTFRSSQIFRESRTLNPYKYLGLGVWSTLSHGLIVYIDFLDLWVRDSLNYNFLGGGVGGGTLEENCACPQSNANHRANGLNNLAV